MLRPPPQLRLSGVEEGEEEGARKQRGEGAPQMVGALLHPTVPQAWRIYVCACIQIHVQACVCVCVSCMCKPRNINGCICMYACMHVFMYARMHV